MAVMGMKMAMAAPTTEPMSEPTMIHSQVMMWWPTRVPTMAISMPISA